MAQQVTSIRKRYEAGRVRDVDPEPLLLHTEIAHDLRHEEAAGIGGAGYPETGDDLLGHAGTAHDWPSFENGDLEACPGEIPGRDQPVVPAAYDDGVDLAIT